MAMLTMGQFTLGSVMEEQTRNKRKILKSSPTEKVKESQRDADMDTLTSDVINTIENEAENAFAFGIQLIVKGLKK